MATKNKIGKSFSYVSIEGFEEIKKALDKLPLIIAKNALRLAVKEASELLAVASERKLRANGSYVTGQLARSIGVVDTSSEARNVGDINMKITARRGDGFSGNHAHLVEFGHKLVIIHPISKKIIKTRKKRVKAYPFFRPAFQANTQKSIDVATRRIATLLPSIIKKLMPGASTE